MRPGEHVLTTGEKKFHQHTVTLKSRTGLITRVYVSSLKPCHSRYCFWVFWVDIINVSDALEDSVWSTTTRDDGDDVCVFRYSTFMNIKNFIYWTYCSWASLLCITPPKRYYHLAFLKTYQAFKNREGKVYQKNLAEWFKIWHLWVETNKNMDDL